MDWKLYIQHAPPGELDRKSILSSHSNLKFDIFGQAYCYTSKGLWEREVVTSMGA